MRIPRVPVALGGAALCLAFLFSSASPAQAGGPATYHGHASKSGTFTFKGIKTSKSSHAAGPPHQPMNQKTLRHTSSSQTPSVPGTPIAAGTGGATGFPGIDLVQQTDGGTSTYAGTQLDSTPPDQGLCVGQGVVVEAVNDAIQVFGPTGSALTPAIPLNQFLSLAPEEVVNPDGSKTYGPFISDPKCYYDPDTSTWFFSVLEIALDPATGNFGTTSAQYIAVSQTPDPTGQWNIYSFDTTDNGPAPGTPSDPACPCFGDQPLIGADANGFYVTTNEYSIAGSGFNGAQLYAMSKAGLEKGSNSIAVTHLQPGSDPSVTNTLGGVAFSVQPATSPNGSYVSAANGTEYFMSSLDFGTGPALGTRASSVAVWNLTNTSSLSTTPALSLHETVVPSELYAQPPNSPQAPGALVISDHLPLLNTNDDRMNQVVYAGGKLWGGLNTAVTTGQATASGLAWFVTTPSTASDGTVTATLAGQGYLSAAREDLFFPSIGVTPAGKAVMTFTLSGPDYHPSAAWAPLSLAAGAGPIHISAAGMAAADDFSAVKAFAGHGVIRWGDYSAAVSDSSGTVWMADEYTSGAEQDPMGNWATFVYKVTP